MNIRNLVVAAVMLPVSMALAQAPGGVALEFESDFGMGESVTKDALQQAQDFLEESGWTQGTNNIWDKNGTFVASIAKASAWCDSDNDDFDICRAAAAKECMLRARQQLARHLALAVATRTQAMAAESMAGLATVLEGGDGTALERALAASLREEIRQSGIDPDSDDAVRYAKNAKAFDTFTDAVESMATAETAALQAFRFFETIQDGKCQLAVVITRSPTGEQLARALMGQGDPPAGAPNQNIAQWAREQGPESLLYAFGCQTRFNEKGELTLVAFGQAVPVTDSDRSLDRAYRAAEEAAVGEMRDFIGTIVTTAAQLKTSTSLTELADKSKQFRGSRTFLDAVNAEAKLAKMTGVSSGGVYQWNTTHPADPSDRVAGVVMTWNVSDMVAANDLRRRLANLGAGLGGAGGSNRYSPAASGSGQSDGAASSDGGSGATGQTRPPRRRGSSQGAGPGGKTP